MKIIGDCKNDREFIRMIKTHENDDKKFVRMIKTNSIKIKSVKRIKSIKTHKVNKVMFFFQVV